MVSLTVRHCLIFAECRFQQSPTRLSQILPCDFWWESSPPPKVSPSLVLLLYPVTVAENNGVDSITFCTSELKESVGACQDSENLDSSNPQAKLDYPQPIVLAQTELTDGIETTLTTSYDINHHSKMSKPFKQSNSFQDHCGETCSEDSLIAKVSNDSTAAVLVATSASQSTETMYVRECNSKLCNHCHNVHSKKEISFIAAMPLGGNMVNKLRSQPPKWYDFGVSCTELYNEANCPSRKQQSKRGS